MQPVPDLICINAVYFWENTGRLFEMLSQLRICGFQGHIHLFGFFPTLAWKAILAYCPAIDSIAAGEPEHTLCELTEALDKGTALDSIAGLAVRTLSEIYFADPNFIGPGKKGRERSLTLAGLICPLNITFGMETRPDDLTPEILEKLTESGLTSLFLGIESGSGAMLKQLKKSVSCDVAENAIRLCRQAGIEPEIGFLMFVADSTLG
jgi:radical SAM superfamily enzyme YgiQ (UPF0313 family)